MKAKYIYTLLLGFIALMTVSCEDRLDIAQNGNLGGMEDYYQTDDEALAASASMYASWRSAFYNWWFLKNLLADDVWCGGGARGDNTEMEAINEYTFGTDNGFIEDVYSSLYTIIYKANLIIDNMSDDTDVKARAIAEAKFFRGWAHFELVTLYGTAPVVNHLLSSSEYRQANSTAEALWAQVESDFSDAISANALPSKSSASDTETGIRVTKEVAKAYLGKAYLFQGKYTDAATTLDEVINTGLYSLYDGDYDQLLHASTNNCCEAMLECQMRNDAENIWNFFSMWCIMQGWRSSNMSYSTEAQSYLATGTYGFMNPREDLYEAFVEMEGADGYRLNQTMRTYEQMEEVGVSLMEGYSLIDNEGYFMWKNRALLADCVYNFSAFQVLQYVNYRVMRYAEVLLLAAEAHVQGGGSTDKALEYINTIRTRAQLSSLTSVTLDDVKKEKRLELCLESVRFQDLVRWGDAETALASQGKEIPSLQNDATSGIQVTITNTNTTYGFKTKHNLLPIPLKELEVNPNMSQNEGW
ncbi:MAG: RagB/SusD family nutrient uptake outer membrane protein [Bacteroides sp.]|nr:RagB/SusD family nutrient uptake outer membrane protein [Bacteroides sp.]